MDKFKEKRRTPRIDEKLPIKVKDGEYCTMVETKNVSASGVYFIADKPMPLMSKVIITLLLPSADTKEAKLDCGGTVVRVVPTDRDGKTLYETAIFFDDISEKTKNLLSRHVKNVLGRG